MAEYSQRPLVALPQEITLVMVPPWQTKMAPLGLAYLSTYLESNHIATNVVDLNVQCYHQGTDPESKFLWSIEAINNYNADQITAAFISRFRDDLEQGVAGLIDSSVPLIGFSTTVASIGIAVYLARRIKEKDPSRIIIMGGPGIFWDAALVDPQRIVDIFVIGEGENPLLEIARRYRQKKRFADLIGIPGTIIKFQGSYQPYLPPDPCRDLRTIPFPTFKEFRLAEYSKEDVSAPLPVLISRGCINQCSYCIDFTMNAPFRVKNPQEIIRELRYYCDRYKVYEFEFNDLLCNGNLKQLEQLCDLLIAERLGVHWSSYAAIRTDMSLPLCEKMHKAGCRYLCYGMESGSDRVLQKMNKRYDSAVAAAVLRNTHEAGIKTAINIIVGHPGETHKAFKETCKFIKKNRGYIDAVTNASTCFLMHGSDLMKHPDRYGIYFKPTLKDWLNHLVHKHPFAPNHRRFYSYKENTPRIRARRLRIFLRLLHRLDIPNSIVNLVKEEDRRFDIFMRRFKKQAATLTYKKWDIDCNKKGYCRLFWEKKEITCDVGLNTSLQIDGQWIDSSSAVWSLKKERRVLQIFIQWKDHKITQVWRIMPEQLSIVWHIQTEFQIPREVFQQKTGILLSRSYNKLTRNGYPETVFPPTFTETWQELLVAKETPIQLYAEGLLPSLRFESRMRSTPFIQVQNAHQRLQGRMVNFCHFEREDQPHAYAAGNKTEEQVSISIHG